MAGRMSKGVTWRADPDPTSEGQYLTCPQCNAELPRGDSTGNPDESVKEALSAHYSNNHPGIDPNTNQPWVDNSGVLRDPSKEGTPGYRWAIADADTNGQYDQNEVLDPNSSIPSDRSIWNSTMGSMPSLNDYISNHPNNDTMDPVVITTDSYYDRSRSSDDPEYQVHWVPKSFQVRGRRKKRKSTSDPEEYDWDSEEAREGDASYDSTPQPPWTPDSHWPSGNPSSLWSATLPEDEEDQSYSTQRKQKSTVMDHLSRTPDQEDFNPETAVWVGTGPADPVSEWYGSNFVVPGEAPDMLLPEWSDPEEKYYRSGKDIGDINYLPAQPVSGWVPLTDTPTLEDIDQLIEAFLMGALYGNVQKGHPVRQRRKSLGYQFTTKGSAYRKQAGLSAYDNWVSGNPDENEEDDPVIDEDDVDENGDPHPGVIPRTHFPQILSPWEIGFETSGKGRKDMDMMLDGLLSGEDEEYYTDEDEVPQFDPRKFPGGEKVGQQGKLVQGEYVKSPIAGKGQGTKISQDLALTLRKLSSSLNNVCCRYGLIQDVAAAQSENGNPVGLPLELLTEAKSVTKLLGSLNPKLRQRGKKKYEFVMRSLSSSDNPKATAWQKNFMFYVTRGDWNMLQKSVKGVTEDSIIPMYKYLGVLTRYHSFNAKAVNLSKELTSGDSSGGPLVRVNPITEETLVDPIECVKIIGKGISMLFSYHRLGKSHFGYQNKETPTFGDNSFGTDDEAKTDTVWDKAARDYSVKLGKSWSLENRLQLSKSLEWSRVVTRKNTKYPLTVNTLQPAPTNGLINWKSVLESKDLSNSEISSLNSHPFNDIANWVVETSLNTSGQTVKNVHWIPTEPLKLEGSFEMVELSIDPHLGLKKVYIGLVGLHKYSQSKPSQKLFQSAGKQKSVTFDEGPGRVKQDSFNGTTDGSYRSEPFAGAQDDWDLASQHHQEYLDGGDPEGGYPPDSTQVGLRGISAGRTSKRAQSARGRR